jgi:hypothetical protein
VDPAAPPDDASMVPPAADVLVVAPGLGVSWEESPHATATAQTRAETKGDLRIGKWPYYFTTAKNATGCCVGSARNPPLAFDAHDVELERASAVGRGTDAIRTMKVLDAAWRTADRNVGRTDLARVDAASPLSTGSRSAAPGAASSLSAASDSAARASATGSHVGIRRAAARQHQRHQAPRQESESTLHGSSEIENRDGQGEPSAQ